MCSTGGCTRRHFTCQLLRNEVCVGKVSVFPSRATVTLQTLAPVLQRGAHAEVGGGESGGSGTLGTGCSQPVCLWWIEPGFPCAEAEQCPRGGTSRAEGEALSWLARGLLQRCGGEGGGEGAAGAKEHRRPQWHWNKYTYYCMRNAYTHKSKHIVYSISI